MAQEPGFDKVGIHLVSKCTNASSNVALIVADYNFDQTYYLYA